MLPGFERSLNKMPSWVTFGSGILDLCTSFPDEHEPSFTYVDSTTEPNSRPFYVGKGNIDRLRFLERNALHRNIRNKHGFRRTVVFVSADETAAFDRETVLIQELRTFNCDEPGWWGANMSLGGEGPRGAGVVKIEQLTLEGLLVTVHPSVKAAKLAVPGSNPVLAARGTLATSKGFRWRYVDPTRQEFRRSDTTRQRMKDAAPKRSVVQFDTTGRRLAVFATAELAALETGVGFANVRRACWKVSCKGWASAGGFLWAYSEDVELLCQLHREKLMTLEQLDPAGVVIARFRSVTEASVATGIHATNISGCCCGTRGTAGGYRWRYADMNTDASMGTFDP